MLLEVAVVEVAAQLEHVGRLEGAGELQELHLIPDVSFIKNNIDHYTGATFGCHENYLVRRTAPLTETNVLSLLSFLTLRLLYTGAGRVGTTLAAEWRGEISRPR